jgi:hypothetical protein
MTAALLCLSAASALCWLRTLLTPCPSWTASHSATVAYGLTGGAR